MAHSVELYWWHWTSWTKSHQWSAHSYNLLAIFVFPRTGTCIISLWHWTKVQQSFARLRKNCHVVISQRSAQLGIYGLELRRLH